MAKDPAFLFYPGDWSLGTMHMTLLEKGAYFELLMLQFAHGKFSIAHAKHMLNGSFDLVWATVKEKFETDGEFFWNSRLETEKTRRSNFTKSRRDNALKDKIEEFPLTEKKAYDKASAKHMLQHMENENENINKEESVFNKNLKGNIFFQVPTLEDVISYCNKSEIPTEIGERAFRFYSAGNWIDSNGKKVLNWKQKIENWFQNDKIKNQVPEPAVISIPKKKMTVEERDNLFA